MFMILITFVCVVSTINAYTYSDETSLHTALTASYDAAVRPDDLTTAEISFGIMSISGLDIKTQTFTLTGFLTTHWTDSRLTWDPSSYGGTTHTNILFSKVWTPNLLINNAADGIKIINDDSDLASVYVYVSFGGEVSWLAPVNIASSCSVNIQNYPFDSQSCDIIVSSWMFNTQQLFFYPPLSEINKDLYEENGEWDITKTASANTTRTLLGFALSGVHFTIDLQRKYSYYVITMILPVAILALLGPLVFLLPSESGEQNGYSLTIMLSLSVIMTTVADSIPPTATHISVLSVYLLTTFILCAVETLFVVLMSRCQRNHAAGYTLGIRTNRATHLMAKLTYYRRPEDQNDTKKTESTTCLVSEVDLKEKARSTPLAWNKEKQQYKDEEIASKCNQGEIIYSYEEFVHVFNSFNFAISMLLTVIITVVFMVILIG